MKKLALPLILLLIAILVLPSCKSADGTSQTASGAASTTDSDDVNGTDEPWKKNVGSITLGSEISVTGQGVSTDGNTVTVAAGGDFTVSGKLEDGMILVNTNDKVKLRLNGADITNTKGPAIFFQNTKKSFITICQGTENLLTDGSQYGVDAKAALFSNDTLEIKGSGSLKIKANYAHAIASDDDIIIEEGTIALESVKDGLHANDNITVNGGELTCVAKSDGIESEGNIIIGGGVIEVSAENDGIHAETDISITAGSIKIGKSVEGIEGKQNISISGGSIRVKSIDDALNAGIDISIDDGNLFVDSEADGIDANGNLIINGGYLVVFAGNNANGPLDAGDGYEMKINGGTVIAAGGNMGINASDSSSQCSMWVSTGLSKGELLNISDGEKEIASFTALKDFSLVFVTCPELSAGVDYSIYGGGSDSAKITDGVFEKGGYQKGNLLGNVKITGKSGVYGSMNTVGHDSN